MTLIKSEVKQKKINCEINTKKNFNSISVINTLLNHPYGIQMCFYLKLMLYFFMLQYITFASP